MLRNTEAERLNALYDSLVSQVALKVLVNEPLDDILQFICRQLVALFNLRLVCIGLKEPEGGGVNIRAAAGPGLDCMHETGVPGNNMPAFPLVVHGRSWERLISVLPGAVSWMSRPLCASVSLPGR